MKRFSQLKLTKGLILLFVVTAINLVYYAFPVYYYDALHVQAQLSQLQQQPPQQQQKPSPIISVKITSPLLVQVNKFQQVSLPFQEDQQIIQPVIVQYMRIGTVQSH